MGMGGKASIALMAVNSPVLYCACRSCSTYHMETRQQNEWVKLELRSTINFAETSAARQGM